MIDWAAGRGWLTAEGKRLEWAAFGPAPENRPVLVLLHEGLGCVALWRDFPVALAKASGLAVFAYSRAGYGRSDPTPLPRPLDYMTREATGALPDVLDSIGAQEVILLGHSDGATIAAEFAGRTTDPRLRGLILVAPHFFTEPRGLAEIARAKAAYDAGDLRGRMAKYHDDPDIAFRGWNDAWLDPEFEHWDVTEVLDTIHVPTLVIQGEADPYGTMAQVHVVADRSPCTVDICVLPNCGHAPHLEATAQTLAEIKPFIARCIR